VLFVDYHFNQK